MFSFHAFVFSYIWSHLVATDSQLIWALPWSWHLGFCVGESMMIHRCLGTTKMGKHTNSTFTLCFVLCYRRVWTQNAFPNTKPHKANTLWYVHLARHERSKLRGLLNEDPMQTIAGLVTCDCLHPPKQLWIENFNLPEANSQLQNVYRYRLGHTVKEIRHTGSYFSFLTDHTYRIYSMCHVCWCLFGAAASRPIAAFPLSMIFPCFFRQKEMPICCCLFNGTEKSIQALPQCGWIKSIRL